MAMSRTIQPNVLITLFSYCLLTTSVWAQDYKGAACVIFVNDNAVFVRDFLSNRMSFPGGYVNRGESPEQTAKRETYEETGLNVNIGPQISAANRSAQYLCKSKTPVPILSRQGFEHMPIVYSLTAPHFSIEIRQVYLIDAQSIEASELRFPSQIKSLPDFKRYPEWQSSAVVLTEQEIPASNLHKIELQAILQMQKWLAPYADQLFRLFNLMGENSLFFIFIPFIWAYAGWQTGVRCVLLLILSAELNNVLKVIFTQPRPFHLMPQLQRMAAYGFGMPSGHTLVATAFWGYCWHSFKHLLPLQKQKISFGMLVFLLIGCAFARAYWGVHFFSDVLAGAIFGLIMLGIFLQLEKTGVWQQVIFTKKLLWAIGLTIIIAVAFFTPGSLSSQLGGLTLGLFLGLSFGTTQALHEKIAVINQGKLSLSALGIVGIMLLDRTGKILVSHQSDSIIAMLIYFASYALIGLWLTIGMYLLPLCKQRIKFHTNNR
jgi:membrane-associated phospholipid phosphatase/8-oxo-dGTP pyrophosphatase MutT (NUDIX family)